MTSDKATALEQRLNALLGDQWSTLGSPSNGWSVGGHAQVRLSVDNCLIVAIKDLQPGTATDGTTVWSAGNGLPARCQPNSDRILVAYCDRTAMWSTANVAEMAALKFYQDGHIECFGISGSGVSGAGATRVDCYGIFPIDD